MGARLDPNLYIYLIYINMNMNVCITCAPPVNMSKISWGLYNLDYVSHYDLRSEAVAGGLVLLQQLGHLGHGHCI